MKLNEEFVLFDMDGSMTLVPTEDAAENYHGIVKCNETATFIIECLQTETTKEEIVNKMLEELDASKERIEANVDKTIDILKSIGAIIE